MGFKNELIGQSNFPPSAIAALRGWLIFPNRQVLPKRLGKYRPGRLRLRICRQRAGLRKAESWATGEAKGSGFAISRIAQGYDGPGSPDLCRWRKIRKYRSGGEPD
jgi:hypothetical protein